MKTTGKIMSAILAAAMMFGLTACSKKTDISPEALIKATSVYNGKSYDDADKFLSKYDDLEEYGKPIVLSVEGEDAQEYYDDFFNMYGYYADVDVETLVAFAFDYDDYENNGLYGYMVMTSIVCESEDEAQKLYESLISGVANKDDPKIISEDEYEPFVVVYEERPEVPDICHWGIYKQGDTVLYLDGLTDDKDTEVHQMFKDICKKLNIKDPAEAVKESDK